MEFRAFVQRADSELDLLEGAVHVARLEYPALGLPEVSDLLDQIAEPLQQERLAQQSPLLQAASLAEYLHVRCGFRGNVANYHDPENSFVNQVLERKLGIPISLSLVYMEVARRCGVRARGVGFPGHFLVRLDGLQERVVIDPFFGGAVLDNAGLARLLERIAPRMPFSEEMLQPVSPRQMLARMLMNLRGIYGSRAEPGRLLAVLDQLIDLMPEALDEVRERGLLYAKLGATQAALADLEQYLAGMPYAGDADEVRAEITRLREHQRPQN